MLTPFMALYVVFVLAPIALTVALSFTTWNGISSPQVVGLANYRSLIGTSEVLRAFENLLIYVAIDVPLGMLVGLALAIFVDRFSRRWSSFLRSVLFFPFVMPLFLTAAIWRWMLTPSFGLVDQVLTRVGVHDIEWLTNPTYMIPALVMVDIWHSAGFNMLLLLAGLKAIPADTLEAARIDGANLMQEIRYVMLPQLAPVFFVVTVNALISAFQVFDLPWLLTQSGFIGGAGGPEQRLLFPVMEAVTRGLGSLRFGESAVIGVALLGLILTVTAGMFAVRRIQGGGQ